MPGNTPSFMQHLDTGDGEPSVTDVLLDKPPATETPATETKTETPKTETTPATETPAGGEKKEEKKEEAKPAVTTPEKKEEAPKEEVYNAADILKKKPEERTDKEKEELEKHPEVLSDEQKKQLADEKAAVVVPPKKEEKKEEKPAATDAAARAAAAVAKPDDAANKKLMETVETLKKIPLINPKIPDPANYFNDDKTFNMAGWAKDFTRNFSLSIQQSLLGGTLSATMFGLLQNALRQEDTERQTQASVDAESNSIKIKLEDSFPVFKTDESLQTRFVRAVYGEKQLRAAKAQEEGKEPEKMKYEDYFDILKDLVGAAPAQPTKQQEDVIERIPSSPQLRGGEQPNVPEILTDIDAMAQAKKRQLF